MWEAAKPLLFEGVKTGMSFCVAGEAVPDILTCLQKCRKSFCLTGAILLQAFQKMSCIFSGRRSTLETSIVILRDRRSIFANRNVRAASSGVNVQIPWQAWDMVRVWFYVASVAFDEDPSCVECQFSWQARYLAHSTPHTPHLHFTLHALHFTLHTAHFTLHTSHFILYIPHFTLYSWLSTLYLHFTLYTPHFRLYTPHFALYTLHSALYTLHFTLHTPNSTLYTTLHTLYTPHFTLHTPHSTLHTLHFSTH